jgi:hypothetical protein
MPKFRGVRWLRERHVNKLIDDDNLEELMDWLHQLADLLERGAQVT